MDSPYYAKFWDKNTRIQFVGELGFSAVIEINMKMTRLHWQLFLFENDYISFRFLTPSFKTQKERYSFKKARLCSAFKRKMSPARPRISIQDLTYL